MWKLPALAVIALAVVIATWGGVSLASLVSNGVGTGAAESYNVDLNMQSDPAGVDSIIWGVQNPPPHNIKLLVNPVPGTTEISISSTPPFIKVSGAPQGTSLTASGNGPAGNCQSASATFVGTYTPASGPQGKYTISCRDPAWDVSYVVKPKPPTSTPTRTPTPTPSRTPTPRKLYSIIVIKVNDNTLQRLPDWPMSLFSSSGCQGGSITQLTNSQGLADFEGLLPGAYSVREGARTGWNPDGPTCQNVTVGPASSAGVSCPIPNDPFPQPGCDSFQSVAKVIVTIDGTSTTSTADLFGPTLIERSTKPHDPGSGHDTIDTEIIALNLTGGGMTVHLAPGTHSTGQITERTNAMPGTLEFPADSFFDIFFEIDIGTLTLHNQEPLRMECAITEVPPYKCFYEPVFGPIGLYDSNNTRIATLVHGFHLPIPPNEKVIIFSNRPKGTPTPTPTSTRTLTPTATSLTPRPTNPPPNGSCTFVTADAFTQGKHWIQWKCTPAAGVPPFNRIDIFVGKPGQAQKLSNVDFECQSPYQKVLGVLKGQKKNANPGTSLPNFEVWSADFIEKCQGGANVYIQAVNPATNNPQIAQVAFTNTSNTPTPTATPTRTSTATPTPTPTNKPPNGACTRVNPIGQTVTYQGQTWESQWSCSRNAAVGPYNRVDIIVQEINGVPRVADLHFECLTTHEKAVGVFKFHKDSDPLAANPVDWWSADFLQKCDGKVMVYFKPIDPSDHTIGPAYPVFKNIASTPTPTPANPPPNGDCVKTKQNVTFQNKHWDLWSCSPASPPPFQFSRVDISVAVGPPPATKLSAVHMVCSATGEKVAGVFKAHKSNVNVQPGQPPDHEVWSAQFSHKCRQKVLVYIQTVNPDNHAVIKEVAFTNPTLPTVTPTPTRTPHPHNGDANKDGVTNPVDAALVLQYSAGLIGSINPDSDVNNDGTTNPVDAALILQFSADLIHSLPV